jgi:ketosteroid isomerase-like protein
MVQGAEGPTRLTRGEIHQRVADMTASRLAGEINGFMDHFAEDVVAHHNCTKTGLFTSGVLHGKAEFRQNLEQTDEVYLGVDGELLDVLVEDQRAWVRWRARWLHIGTGKAYDLDMAYFLRWRDDKVVELHEFFDTPTPSPAGRLLASSFEDIITPKPSGLSRNEIIAVGDALANFPTRRGPDIALIEKYCAPNVVCEFVGDRKRISYAGRHVGVAALCRIVRDIATDFEQLDYELSDVVVDEGRVALHRSVEWRHRGTGRRGVVELAEFVRFEDGLIVEIIEFRDSISLIAMGS